MSDFYLPSLLAGLGAELLAYLIYISGCPGLTLEQCTAVNGYCLDGGCF